jgi:histidinol-phosphatase (PHP family)
MLTYSLEMVEISDFIDAFAHIDYISRYSPLADPVVHYGDFAAGYDALLKTLAQREIALEINTSRFGQIPGLEKNLFRVYQRFHALGGRFCTVGSDGHDIQSLGRFHGEALVLAREAGLSPVFFKNRKRYACD